MAARKINRDFHVLPVSALTPEPTPSAPLPDSHIENSTAGAAGRVPLEGLGEVRVKMAPKH